MRVLYFLLHYSGSMGSCLSSGWIALSLPHACFGEPVQSKNLGKCLPVFLCGSKLIPFSKSFPHDMLEFFQAPDASTSKTEAESELISSLRIARLQSHHFLLQHLKRDASFSLYILIFQGSQHSNSFSFVPYLISRWMKAIASNRFCLLPSLSVIYPGC